MPMLQILGLSEAMLGGLFPELRSGAWGGCVRVYAVARACPRAFDPPGHPINGNNPPSRPRRGPIFLATARPPIPASERPNLRMPDLSEAGPEGYFRGYAPVHGAVAPPAIKQKISPKNLVYLQKCVRLNRATSGESFQFPFGSSFRRTIALPKTNNQPRIAPLLIRFRLYPLCLNQY